jgi:hypothetical protein
MTLKIRMYLGSAAFAAALLSPSFAGAQQKTAQITQGSFAYDPSTETQIQGTVVSYTASSQTAPIGPRATIRTSSGNVDVHLGNADTMKINDVFLAAGDSVKIVGASHNFGNGDVFLARVLQKGNQTVTLRNAKGLAIAPKRDGTVVKVRSAVGGAR